MILIDANLLVHGLILCSTGSEFTRCPELRWENPLA